MKCLKEENVNVLVDMYFMLTYTNQLRFLEL